MRILFIAGSYWPATGGAQALIRHVAHGLARGHEVVVLADRIDDLPTQRLSESLRHPPAFSAFDDGPVRVVALNLSAARRLALLPLVAQVTPGLRRYAYGRLRIGMLEFYARVVAPLCREHVAGADIVHVWAGGFIGAVALRAGRAAGRPVVMTPFVHPGQWGDDLASRRMYRRVDRVVSLLETEAATLRNLGVEAARIATCGVCAPSVELGGGSELRARLAIDGPLVLFLGVRRPYKGYDLLLAAADRVSAAVPGVCFAFVGPGPALAAEASHARILDVGMVDDRERGAWLEAADLLCLPSSNEIFPVSVLEAWSARTAVVLSDLPPLVELLDRSGGGVAVARAPEPLADALIDLLLRSDKRGRLAEAGHRFWREGHTPDAIAACHEHLYTTLIDEAACAI